MEYVKTPKARLSFWSWSRDWVATLARRFDIDCECDGGWIWDQWTFHARTNEQLIEFMHTIAPDFLDEAIPDWRSRVGIFR